MRYDVTRNPDGTTTINGFTFPAGSVPETCAPSARVARRSDGLATTQAQTLRRAAEIAAGRHPFGRRLREPRGQTCRTCAHVVGNAVRSGKTFYKCGQMRDQWTRGPGSDLRLSWPACTGWQPGPLAPPDPPPPPPEPDPFAPALEGNDASGLSPTIGGRSVG